MRTPSQGPSYIMHSNDRFPNLYDRAPASASHSLTSYAAGTQTKETNPRVSSKGNKRRQANKGTKSEEVPVVEARTLTAE